MAMPMKGRRMRILLVHPSALMYSELYLRLEPLGLERVASALQAEGHDVRMVDLQVYAHRDHLAPRPRAASRTISRLDPSWDESRFAAVREWAAPAPEIVHLTVQTPYPGTETWHSESRHLTTRDYRLFDIQHAVLPTALPLAMFYEELVKTQAVLARKHLGVAALAKTTRIVARHLAHGQTNFLRMIWNFGRVYNAGRQLADHSRTAIYELPEPPSHPGEAPDRGSLYVHVPVRQRQRVASDPVDKVAGRPGS